MISCASQDVGLEQKLSLGNPIICPQKTPQNIAFSSYLIRFNPESLWFFDLINCNMITIKLVCKCIDTQLESMDIYKTKQKFDTDYNWIFLNSISVRPAARRINKMAKKKA